MWCTGAISYREVPLRQAELSQQRCISVCHSGIRPAETQGTAFEVEVGSHFRLRVTAELRLL